MITKLHVQNFKCLRDVSVELKPFTVLIGKNDTGKSSLLEAIHTLSGLVQAKPEQPAVPIDQLAWKGADPPWIEWSVEVAATPRNHLPGAGKYDLRVSPSAKDPGGVYPNQEALSVEGQLIHVGFSGGEGTSRTIHLREGNTVFNRHPEVFDRTALSVAATEQGLYTIKAFIKSLMTSAIFRFDAERLMQPAPFDVAFDSPENELVIAPDGFGLPVLLDAILGFDRAAYDAIQAELHAAVPYVKGIRLKQTRFNGQAPAKVGKSILFDLGGGSEIEAPLASQGVMLFLAYLALSHAPSSPAILLIEEPENGIHPRQLQRVAEYLKRLTDPARGKDAVQIVTATHSPYFLDFVPPEDVLVFGRKDNGETVVRPLLSLPGVKERLDGGFSLGEMWFNVGEDRLLAEALA